MPFARPATKLVQGAENAAEEIGKNLNTKFLLKNKLDGMNNNN